MMLSKYRQLVAVLELKRDQAAIQLGHSGQPHGQKSAVSGLFRNGIFLAEGETEVAEGAARSLTRATRLAFCAGHCWTSSKSFIASSDARRRSPASWASDKTVSFLALSRRCALDPYASALTIT